MIYEVILYSLSDFFSSYASDEQRKNLMTCNLLSFEVGSFEEAKKAINVGVDAIIVQGREAGGHVIGQV